MARGIVNVGRGLSIKSVQSCAIGMESGSTSTITITPVDLSKAVIIYTGSRVASGSDIQRMSYLELINATTVRTTRKYHSTGWTDTRFMVVEFENVKSIQQGVIALSSRQTENTVTVNEVSGKAVLFLLGYSPNSAEPSNLPLLHLANSTTVRVSREDSPAITYTSYMLVDFK